MKPIRPGARIICFHECCGHFYDAKLTVDDQNPDYTHQQIEFSDCGCEPQTVSECFEIRQSFSVNQKPVSMQ